MTIAEITAAVDRGARVHWANTGYEVRRDRFGAYHIVFTPNGNCIGLTDRSGTRLNGRPEAFFLAPSC